MTRRPSRPAERATDREVGVVAAVHVAGSEKAAAHRLGPSHLTAKHRLASLRAKLGAETPAQFVWMLGSRLPEPKGRNKTDDLGLPGVRPQRVIEVLRRRDLASSTSAAEHDSSTRDDRA